MIFATVFFMLKIFLRYNSPQSLSNSSILLYSSCKLSLEVSISSRSPPVSLPSKAASFFPSLSTKSFTFVTVSFTFVTVSFSPCEVMVASRLIAV